MESNPNRSYEDGPNVHEYGPNVHEDGPNVHEDGPNVAYEESKLAGEIAVREYSQNSNYSLIIIRPAWVYGPRCTRTERLFRTIKKGRFFFVGDGRTLRHPIYISDMVAGFKLASKYSCASSNSSFLSAIRPILNNK